jgi:hypothetical protein
MLPSKEFAKGGAHAALMLNAFVAETAPARRVTDACTRCGLVRVVHSSIIVIAAEVDGSRIVEAPLCGSCTRRMSR